MSPMSSPGSLADDAGLKVGDVIREVNRIPIKDLNDYDSAIRKSERNRPALFLVKRGAQTFYVTIQIS